MTTCRIEDHGPVRVITIARPQVRNAVDGPTANALAQAFRDFDADDSAHVAILTGEGDHFCAGADLSRVATGASSNALSADASGLGLDDDMDANGPMGPTRLDLDKPAIAAIEGYAVAGGIELALWCDLRVLGTSATLGVFCRRFGVPLIDGGTVRLPRLIGEARALDLILTGRAVGADEALQLGLASRVVDDGQALAAALTLARQIASFPPSCMRNDRRSARHQGALSLRDALAQEFALGRQTLDSGEAKAGAARFVSGNGKHGRFDA